MNKYIVTTTIQPPTEATYKFSEMKDWTLIIVGDIRTPQEQYKYGNWIYLSPDYQNQHYHNVSEAIGWNCIMRRNIGFLEAYKLGADIVASIDDDNIPYEDWGKDLIVGKDIEVGLYNCDVGILDPMQLTNHPELWHRGYPIDRLYERKKVNYLEKVIRKVLFQVSLWKGDPDVDALCRLMYKPTDLQLTVREKFSSNNFIPFNSQNTFIDRSALSSYMVLPYVGRSDDIWGGYIAQHLLNTRPVFTHPTVYQKRNDQSIYKNLDDELFGYMWTNKFVENIEYFEYRLPTKTLKAFDLYRKEYETFKNI
jgi:hypothetical protein